MGQFLRIKSIAQLAVESWKYRRVKPHAGLANHHLKPHQVYPAGRNLETFYLRDAELDETFRFIGRRTPTVSLGACFGEEFKYHFQRRAFNYLQPERNKWAIFCSCGWGRVVTTADLRQVFQYTFGELKADQRLYETVIGSQGKKVIDPYRDMVVYDTLDEGRTDLPRHEAASLEALTECRALVITLGQNEVWVNDSDQTVFAHHPTPDLFDRLSFTLKKLTFLENLENLEKVIGYLLDRNPECKVILSVSPVPSHASFSGSNVVEQSLENKCVLVLAAKELARRYPQVVSYFPAFEMVLSAKNALKHDNRHVNKVTVLRMMAAFDRFYCVE